MSQIYKNTSGGGGGGTSGVGTFQPNAVVELFDDFFPSGISASGITGSQLGWYSIGEGATTITTTDPNHPGVAQFEITNPSPTGLVLQDADNSLDFITGGGVLSYTFTINLVTLSNGTNRYTAIVGLADGMGTGINNGIYFSYSDNVNSGNWVINCSKSGTTTSVNTSVAASTVYQTFTATVNAGGTSVSFYINNIFVGTAITTNIPTTAINALFYTSPTIGNTPRCLIDLFYLYYALTNPRPGPTFSQAIVGTGTLIRAYKQVSSSYQVLNTDSIIGVNGNAGPVTITMPNTGLVIGQEWTIKDENLTAQANNITISGNGANILGATSAGTFAINTNGGAVDVYWNGTSFPVI